VPVAVLLARSDLLADHATGVSERRKVSFDDGSNVELASASSLSLDFSARERRVVLHAGEAFFDVARDDTRPFIVQAAGGSTQALGTSFDVKRHDTEVSVTVIEHAVVVSCSGSRVVLRQGEQFRYGANRLGKVRDADLAEVEAWRRDRLVFHDTPLGDVITDLERYHGGRIVMTDSRLREMPVTAVFDAGQADAALDSIASLLHLRVRRITPFLVIVSG
jgi:transmembrane sensor